MKKIKILIVDDMMIIREGIKKIISYEYYLEVIGVCENGRKAYEMTKELLPNIVIMGIQMPILNGIEALKLIKKDFPEIVVLMLTTNDDYENIIEALANGADGYLLKDECSNKLIDGIKAGFNGKLLMESHIVTKLIQDIKYLRIHSQQKQKKSFQLSERQREISGLLIKGHSNKDIANKLYLSVGTVKNYISSIYAEIGINNRREAIKILKNWSEIKGGI